jgi:hypothetical protein
MHAGEDAPNIEAGWSGARCVSGLVLVKKLD